MGLTHINFDGGDEVLMNEQRVEAALTEMKGFDNRGIVSSTVVDDPQRHLLILFMKKVSSIFLSHQLS